MNICEVFGIMQSRRGRFSKSIIPYTNGNIQCEMEREINIISFVEAK